MIAKIEAGTVLVTCLAERLLSISAGRYDELIQQAKRSPLEYEIEVLLDHHVDKHLDEFDDLTGAAGYQREARRVVRESNRILAHIFEGKGIQFRFFGERGFVLVNARENTLAGYFGPSDIDQAFQGIWGESIWKTERERLAWAADVLRDWKSKYGPGGVDSVFLYLAELDQSQNADLWQEVRKALATNEAFHDPGVQRYFRNEKLAREEQWWRIRPTGRKKPRRYRRHAAARDFVPERNLLSTLPHLVCVAGNGALFSHR